MLVGLLSSALATVVQPANGAAAATPRIAVLDWSLVEVALTIGITPIAASEADGYRQWVSVPTLPPQVVDLGLRVQPNLELLQMLAPTLVLTIPERADIKSDLERIAPTVSLPIYTGAFSPFARACDVTRELGRLTEREAAAGAAVDRAEGAIAAARAKLPADPPPLLVVRFIDARNVFVFGAGGLFDAVMTRMGLKNGWHAPPNRFGFVRTSVLALAQADARSHLFLDNPALPGDVEAMMRSDPLWHALPFVRRDAVTRLPPIWFFGATEAAARFATSIAATLSEPRRSLVPHAG